MKTGIKLLVLLGLILLAGYVEVHAASIPVLQDCKKLKVDRLEETIAMLSGLKCKSTKDGVVTYEVVK